MAPAIFVQQCPIQTPSGANDAPGLGLSDTTLEIKKCACAYPSTPVTPKGAKSALFALFFDYQTGSLAVFPQFFSVQPFFRPLPRPAEVQLALSDWIPGARTGQNTEKTPPVFLIAPGARAGQDTVPTKNDTPRTGYYRKNTTEKTEPGPGCFYSGCRFTLFFLVFLRSAGRGPEV